MPWGSQVRSTGAAVEAGFCRIEFSSPPPVERGCWVLGTNICHKTECWVFIHWSDKKV